MDPNSTRIAENTNNNSNIQNTNNNSNIQNTKPKLFDNTKPYFQGIICNRDTRESGKKRNFWTNIIIVILIISITLLIICITLLLDDNNNWWSYLIFGLLGIIGCVVGHYYNTKKFIEDSKYDIDINDIEAFKNIKNAIKKTKNTISQYQKEIDGFNRQINIIIGKNKAKALASSIASNTSAGFSSLRNKIKTTNTIVPATNTPIDETNPPSMTAAANKQSVQEDLTLQTLKNQLNLAKANLESNKKLLDGQMTEYNRLKEQNDIYKEIKMANKQNLNIIYNISDFYDDIKLLNDIKSIDNKELKSLNSDEKSVSSEYEKIISDINTIKLLKEKEKEMPTKINEISKIILNIPYLQITKGNILDNYIDKFLNDINDTLINESDIDKYFTISKNYSDIYNSLISVGQKQSYLKTKYEDMKLILEPKYTKIAVEEINNMYNEIKSNEYRNDLYNNLVKKYDLYSTYELSNTFKEAYDKIMRSLVQDFSDYVLKSLNLTYNLDGLNTIESIDTDIENYKQSIKKEESTTGKIYAFSNHPILSSKPNKEKFLMDIILQPFIDKKTKLEKAKALAKTTSNNSILQGFTNLLGI